MRILYIIISFTWLLVCITNFSGAQTCQQNFNIVLDKVLFDKTGNIKYNWASDIAGEFERVDLVVGKCKDSIIINEADYSAENIYSVYNKAQTIKKDDLFTKYGYNTFSDSLVGDIKCYWVKDKACNDKLHLYLFSDRSVVHCLGVIGKDGKYDFLPNRESSMKGFENEKSTVFQKLLFDSLCRIKKETIGYIDSLKEVFYSYQTNGDDPIRIVYQLSMSKSNYFVEDCSVHYKWDDMGNWIERILIGKSFGHLDFTDNNGASTCQMFDGYVDRVDYRNIRYKKE